MDRVVEPFVKATAYVLQRMLRGRLMVGEVTDGVTIGTAAQVAVTIGLAGRVSGRFVLSMECTTATFIASTMCRKSVELAAETAIAALGEFANVAAGIATTELDAIGVSMNLTVPRVAIGREKESSLPGGELAGATLQTSAGPINIGVALQRSGIAGKWHEGEWH